MQRDSHFLIPARARRLLAKSTRTQHDAFSVFSGFKSSRKVGRLGHKFGFQRTIDSFSEYIKEKKAECVGNEPNQTTEAHNK